MSVIVACTGHLVEALTEVGDAVPGVLACDSGWVQYAYAPPFNSSQIDPLICTQLFGAGFMLFFTPWAVAWGLSHLVNFIRR